MCVAEREQNKITSTDWQTDGWKSKVICMTGIKHHNKHSSERIELWALATFTTIYIFTFRCLINSTYYLFSTMQPWASWGIIRAKWFPYRPSNTGNTVTTRRASVNSQSTLFAYKDKEDPGIWIYSNLRWYLCLLNSNICTDTVNVPQTVFTQRRASETLRKNSGQGSARIS